MASRRAVLLGSLGVLAACGAPERKVTPTARLVTGSFDSDLVGRPVGWAVAYPPRHRPGDRLPVVVTLHGRGASHRTAFTTLRLQDVLDRSGAGFALVSVDGGDHSYWHRREDGTDAGAMVRSELVPLLARRGLDTTRLGLHGWSMGGYGALLLAGDRATPVRAVAVSSPALFPSATGTPSGAFDSPDDYRRHDVFHEPERLDGVRLRIDCGRSDPFHDATTDFVGRLSAAPVSAFPAGGHTSSYWHRMALPAFRFLGDQLA